MSAFVFRSDRGEGVSAAKWLEIWASKFDNEKYPEDAYKELVASGLGLSDADFDVLGAWKDGGLKISTPNGGRRFGNCWVSFTGRWSATAASCVYRERSKALRKRARFFVDATLEDEVLRTVGE